MVEINPASIQAAIRKIRLEYSHISGDKLNTAVSRALNRAASSSRTEANKNIRKVYNLGQSKINSAFKVRYSQPRTLTVRLWASGSPLALSNFGARQETASERVKFDRKGNLSRVSRKTRKSPVSGVSFEIKRGNKENIPTAFIQSANGGATVFARGAYRGGGEGFEFTKARLPISKLTTSSIPLMFADNTVMQPTQDRALSVFSERVMHEIAWVTR